MKDNKTLALNKIIGFITFIIANIVMAIFLIVTLLNYYKPLSSWFFLMSAFIIFWFIAFIKKLIESFKEDKNYPNLKEFFITLLVILVSTVLTFVRIKYLQIHPVVSAALVSLVFGIALKKYGPEATVGAFLGMSFFNLIYYDLLIAVLIASIINYGLKNYFVGHGGKIGLTAFISGFITFLIMGKPFLEVTHYQGIEIYYLFAVAIISALLTNIINNDLKAGPIIAYSLVSLIGVLIFNNFEHTNALNYSTVVFGASFIGMSSKKVHPSNTRVIFTAIIFTLILAINLNFNYIGGRSGSITIISLIISQGIIYVFTNNYKIVKNTTNNLRVTI